MFRLMLHCSRLYHSFEQQAAHRIKDRVCISNQIHVMSNSVNISSQSTSCPLCASWKKNLLFLHSADCKWGTPFQTFQAMISVSGNVKLLPEDIDLTFKTCCCCDVGCNSRRVVSILCARSYTT